MNAPVPVLLTLAVLVATAPAAASEAMVVGDVTATGWVLEPVDGEPLGRFVEVYQWTDEALFGTAVANRGEERWVVLHRFDPAQDLYTSKLVDVASGWQAELTMRTGLGDHGDARDYQDLLRLSAFVDRMLDENPVVTYELRIRDRPALEVSGRGSEVDDTDLFADLSSQLAETNALAEVPASLINGLRLLATTESSFGEPLINLLYVSLDLRPSSKELLWRPMPPPKPLEAARVMADARALLANGDRPAE